MTLKMLSLFSGIGGIDLSASWAGIETVAFCEIDPFCQRVLAKHWPGVPIFDDVRQLTTESLRQRGIDPESISVVAGGFPCQDISLAGSGIGIEGERSALWSEMFRVVSDLRPRFIVVENVSALLVRGMGRVLGDLSGIGYDAEWEVIPACAFGAPHPRERVFIVAYPCGDVEPCGLLASNRPTKARGKEIQAKREAVRQFAQLGTEPFELVRQWSTQFCASPLVRVADGIPDLLDRLRGIGNGVFPDAVYPIFEAIVTHEAEAA